MSRCSSGAGAADRADPLVDAVERVLDALEPLGDGAHTARQPLEVAGGRKVERAHRDLLRLRRLLARVERTRERAGHERALEQLLREAAEGVLALT